MRPPSLTQRRPRPSSPWQVFLVFSGLGLTSFGGPVAHIGYFHAEFVERRKWLSDRAFADLVALCHFLPGPASSQVGMAIGLQRAGLFGLIAAWLGFTLPSALLMFGAAVGVAAFGDLSQAGWLLGLKAAAVAVVLHALIGMTRSFAAGGRQAALAVAAMGAALLWPTTLTQLAAIIGAGLVGLLLLGRSDLDTTARPGASPEDTFPIPLARGVAISALVGFTVLLLGLPFAVSVTGEESLALFDSFYRSGSFVFGGGHVVLPLLQTETVHAGLVEADVFLAGYGAAQALPGPLFAFAAYLGAVSATGMWPVLGAIVALVAIFLPSALLIIGVLPFWAALRRVRAIRGALSGVGAAVVGLLAAALYDPVFTEGIAGVHTVVIAAVAFVALSRWKTPAWAVVVGAALVGWVLL